MRNRCFAFAICFLLIAGLLLSNMKTALAEEIDDEDEATYETYANLQLDYDDTYTFQPGDVFEMVYGPVDGDDLAIIQIDVSMLLDKQWILDFEVGSYRIYTIRYVGGNSEIRKGNYAVTGDFTIRDNTQGFIMIAVGDGAVQRMTTNYANVAVKGDREDLWENVSDPTFPEPEETLAAETTVPEPETMIPETPAQLPPQTAAETEMYVETPFVPETVPTVEQPLPNPSAEQPSIIDYRESLEETQEDDSEDSSSHFNLMPLIMIAALGGAVIFMLHQRGVF